MPEEMLSFLAGDSTPGSIKPVVCNAIGVPKSEIQKVMHDAKATLPTSERMVQRSPTWLLDVAMARSVMGGKLRKTHTDQENAKCEASPKAAIDAAKLNARR